MSCVLTTNDKLQLNSFNVENFVSSLFQKLKLIEKFSMKKVFPSQNDFWEIFEFQFMEKQESHANLVDLY